MAVANPSTVLPSSTTGPTSLPMRMPVRLAGPRVSRISLRRIRRSWVLPVMSMATPSSPPLSTMTFSSSRLRLGQKSRPRFSSRNRMPTLPLPVMRFFRITLSVSQWPIEIP